MMIKGLILMIITFISLINGIAGYKTNEGIYYSLMILGIILNALLGVYW